MLAAVAPTSSNFPTLLAHTMLSLVAVAGLASAALLVTPAAFSAAPTLHYQRHVWGNVAQERAETVEQRIRTLRASLHITPAQETNWNGVAQAMRDNEARMQDLIAARQAEPAHHVTAPEDLRRYEHFTQARVDGLKLLRTRFDTLYAGLSDAQKLDADAVFDKFGNGHD
jgi:hypothetical protein